MITPDSRKYIGCSWGGWYSYIGLAATGYIRKLQVFSIQYIDDRLISVFLGGETLHASHTNIALQAIYIVCYSLCRLGYTLSLGKSVMEPSQIVLFLGMFVDITTLQSLQGKCMSFALAVPGARLYISQMALAIDTGPSRVNCTLAIP